MLAFEDEERAVTAVSERLAVLFPGIAANVVGDTVRTLHAQFVDRPIRDFIPILIERMAKSLLVAMPESIAVNHFSDDLIG